MGGAISDPTIRWDVILIRLIVCRYCIKYYPSFLHRKIQERNGQYCKPIRVYYTTHCTGKWLIGWESTGLIATVCGCSSLSNHRPEWSKLSCLNYSREKHDQSLVVVSGLGNRIQIHPAPDPKHCRRVPG